MNKKNVIVGATSLLLGVVGGGIAGYGLKCSANSGNDRSGEGTDNSALAGHSDYQIRIVEVEESTASMDEAFREATIPVIDMQGDSLNSLISLLQCRSFENNYISGGIHIAVGHPLIHDSALRDTRFTLQAKNLSVKDILDELTKQTGITYSIRPCAVLWGKTVDPADVDRSVPDNLFFLPREKGLILEIDLRSSPQLLIDGVAFEEEQMDAILILTHPVLERVNLILPKNRDSEMMTRVLRSLEMAQVKTVFLDTPPEKTGEADQDVEPDAFLPPE